MAQMQNAFTDSLQTLKNEKELLNAKLDESHSERKNIQNDLKSISNYTNELEERVYEANSKSLDLLKQVRNLEHETQTLKSYIIDLKARVAVYVPIKDDPTD